jgi:polyisoprenoid-binding protein YceI
MRCNTALGMVCLLLLSSCVTPEKKPAPVATPTPPVVTKAPEAANARRYRIAADQSTLHVLVYRGGTMAQLGHNHVISSATISGEVWLDESLAKSGFNLVLPVNDLIVDDAQARTAEGTDFQAKVSDDARAGTRRNMLKLELLDGEHYPTIHLRSVIMTGWRDAPEVTASITIKDQTREVVVPVQLTIAAHTLKVVGQFDIRQSDFGITPFSVMMGALQVQDQFKIKFELVALRE